MVHFTYSFEELAGNWRKHDALTRHWAARHLKPGCLNFQTAQRAIRMPSVLQVRQPLRQTSTPAAGYGRLMHLLRQLPGAAREAWALYRNAALCVGGRAIGRSIGRSVGRAFGPSGLREF